MASKNVVEESYGISRSRKGKEKVCVSDDEVHEKNVVPGTSTKCEKPPRQIVCALLSADSEQTCHPVKGTRIVKFEDGFFPKYDLFYEGDDDAADLIRFNVYKEIDYGLSDHTPEIPFCASSDSVVELDPKRHCFLVVQKEEKS